SACRVSLFTHLHSGIEQSLDYCSSPSEPPSGLLAGTHPRLMSGMAVPYAFPRRAWERVFNSGMCGRFTGPGLRRGDEFNVLFIPSPRRLKPAPAKAGGRGPETC